MELLPVAESWKAKAKSAAPELMCYNELHCHPAHEARSCSQGQLNNARPCDQIESSWQRLLHLAIIDSAASVWVLPTHVPLLQTWKANGFVGRSYTRYLFALPPDHQ